MYPGIARLRPPMSNTTCSDNTHSTPTKLASSSVGCSRPIASAVVSSVRCCEVLVDALIWIVPDLAGKAQQVGALGCEPLVEQVVGEPLPQLDIGHLPQPGLGDDQHQQATGDDQEYEELVRERRHVPLLDRVVEVALPHVEPDLPRCIGADHEDDASGEDIGPVSSREVASARARLGVG